MFDLSFFEIIVIGVVALIVIGPEKLPVVARTMGKLFGQVQTYITQVKEEVNREARFDELQALQGEIAAGVNKAKAGLQDELAVFEQSADQTKVMSHDKIHDDHKLSAQAKKLRRTSRALPAKKSIRKSRKRQASEKIKSAT